MKTTNFVLAAISLASLLAIALPLTVSAASPPRL